MQDSYAHLKKADSFRSFLREPQKLKLPDQVPAMKQWAEDARGSGNVRYINGLYRYNGKEKGSYYNGFRVYKVYRDSKMFGARTLGFQLGLRAVRLRSRLDECSMRSNFRSNMASVGRRLGPIPAC